MESTPHIEALAALAHPGRLAVFRLLMRRMPQALPAGEIAAIIGAKPSTLSAHLAQLTRAGLIAQTREGTWLRYRIASDGVAALLRYLVADCCRGRPDMCRGADAALGLTIAAPGIGPAGDESEEHIMPDRTFEVLFICTRNSARSIFAEAIVNREGKGKFRARSCGTTEGGSPNPQAVQLLQKLGYDTGALRSKTAAEFQGPDAPRFDFVFTLCDTAANEECPPWPGQPITAHWGMPDPVATAGSESERAFAFNQAYQMLRHRIIAFMALPIESLDRISLQKRLDAIGESGAVPA